MKAKNNTRSRAFRIGIITVITAVLFFFGINYLKGKNVFDRTETYYVILDDTQGLGRSSIVTLNGYRVGNVSDIRFDYGSMSRSIAVLALDRELKLPRGSAAAVHANPFGGAQLRMTLGTESGTIQPGDTIRVINTVSLMDKLEDEIVPSLTQMIASMDTLLANIDKVVSDPNIPSAISEINSSARNIRQTSQRLNALMQNKLPQIVDNIDQTTLSLRNASGAVQASDIETAINDFKAVVERLQAAAGQLEGKDGTLGLLLNDPNMYRQLQRTIESADSLIVDIKQNPKRYLNISIF